ncbi:MAG: hypothetical protein ACT4TC_13665 [Myxococcaceae bacterium]
MSSLVVVNGASPARVEADVAAHSDAGAGVEADVAASVSQQAQRRGQFAARLLRAMTIWAAFVLAPSAQAAVAQDNFVSASVAASSLSMTLNVSAGSVNNAVTVHVIIFGSCGGSCAASTATINGTAFPAQSNFSSMGLESNILSLMDNTGTIIRPGANTINISNPSAGVSSMLATAVSWTGVAGLGTTSSNFGLSTTPNISYTTTGTGSVLIDDFPTRDTGFTPGANQTVIDTRVLAGTTHYVSRKSAPTAGANNISWVGPSTQWMYRSMELRGTTGGTANRIVFTGAPPSAAPNACSGTVTLQLQDEANNPVNGPATLGLSSSDGQMTFYAGAGCAGGAVTSVNVAAGISTATFSFRDTTAGTTTIRASAVGYHSGFQTATIAAVVGSRLAFTTPSRSFTAGTCGGAGNVITVQLQDNASAPVNAGAAGQAFSVSSTSSGTVGWFTNATCTAAAAGGIFTVPSGANSVSLYYRDSQPGSVQVSVTNGSGLINPSAQSHTVMALPASVLAFTSAPQTVAPTQCSPLAAVVEAQDSLGNAVAAPSPRTVSLSANSGSLIFFSDSTCTTPITSAVLSVGSSTLSFHFRESASGTRILTASSAGLTSAQQQQTVQPQVLGGTCGAATECASSVCASGVCCQTACNGACMACNVAGSVGTCAPVSNGTVCPNGVYCDGQETCLAGSCQPSAPVACVDPFGHDVLACQESAQRCERVPNSPPVITQDANLTAGLGQRYIYNVMNAVRVAGDRPMTFSSCAGPPELRLDPMSGAIIWTPAAEGSVPICVRAENAFGADSYSFTVQVGQPTGAGPVARYVATPDEGRMPLKVSFDGSGSSGVTTVVQYGWELFPGMPPLAGVTVQNVYEVPSTYWPVLTVTDTFGRQDSTALPVRVLDEQGGRPPSVRIRASALSGDENLRVDFGCACQAGDAPLDTYAWHFGGGEGEGESVSRDFGPGRYRVSLTVTDVNGMFATDSVEVVVTSGGLVPPRCQAWVFPGLATAPAELLFSSSVGSENGNLRSVSWSLWDGSETSGTDRRVQVDTAGFYRGVLRAEDEAGMTCEASAEAWIADSNGKLPTRLGPAEYVVGCACSTQGGSASAYALLLWASLGLLGLQRMGRRDRQE